MSAVRMVAYGVLELPSHADIRGGMFAPEDDKKLAELRDKRFKFDELMKLVKDELRANDLLLSPKVEHFAKARREHGTTYIVYGPLKGHSVPMRGVVGEGNFKACCIAAAEYLDKHQIPE